MKASSSLAWVIAAGLTFAAPFGLSSTSRQEHYGNPWKGYLYASMEQEKGWHPSSEVCPVSNPSIMVIPRRNQEGYEAASPEFEYAIGAIERKLLGNVGDQKYFSALGNCKLSAARFYAHAAFYGLGSEQQKAGNNTEIQRALALRAIMLSNQGLIDYEHVTAQGSLSLRGRATIACFATETLNEVYRAINKWSNDPSEKAGYLLSRGFALTDIIECKLNMLPRSKN